jgi:hypothetical protein
LKVSSHSTSRLFSTVSTLRPAALIAAFKFACIMHIGSKELLALGEWGLAINTAGFYLGLLVGGGGGTQALHSEY